LTLHSYVNNFQKNPTCKRENIYLPNLHALCQFVRDAVHVPVENFRLNYFGANHTYNIK